MTRLIVFVLVVGGLALTAAVLGLAPNAHELRDFGESLGWAGYVLWVPLTTLLASAFVPGPVLAGAAGLLRNGRGHPARDHRCHYHRCLRDGHRAFLCGRG